MVEVQKRFHLTCETFSLKKNLGLCNIKDSYNVVEKNQPKF